ncbi:MAG: hypothetical protein WCE35_00795 [Bradyrhizobium sp.]
MAGSNPVGRELHAPAGDVFDRSLAQDGVESFGEHGARRAGLARQILHRPAAAGVAMHGLHRPADDRVVERREPSFRAGGQLRGVATQHLDEQHFHQPAEDQFGAGRGGFRHRHDLPHGGGDQRADLIVVGAVDQQRRQGAEHGGQQKLGRFQKPADHPGFRTAAAVVDVPHSRDRAGTHDIVRIGHCRCLAVPELMLVGKRHQQDIAGRDMPALAGRQFDAALAGRNQVENADMAQPRHRRALVEPPGADDAERGREARIQKHRPGQAHRAQHFREHIPPGVIAFQRSGKGRRRLDH